MFKDNYYILHDLSESRSNILLTCKTNCLITYAKLHQKVIKRFFNILLFIIMIMTLSGCTSDVISDSIDLLKTGEDLSDGGTIVWGEIHVPDDYNSIQAAIEAAKSGEIIVVSPGIYKENINFQGKNIAIISTEPDNPDIVAQTVIDGNNQGTTVIFNSGEGAEARLEGLTITGGNGTQGEYEIESYDGTTLNFVRNYGGGILVASGSNPTICNNVITKNEVKNISADILGVGGGIAILDNSSPELVGNTVSDNKAEGHGGGIAIWYHSNPVIVNNSVSDNAAGDIGGGIMVAMMSSPRIKENLIKSNSASWGGGIYVAHMSEAEIISNNIELNEAESGAGVFARKTAGVLLADNVISGNTVRRYGGAVYLDNHAIVAIHYNYIENNQAASAGGGLWVDQDSRAYLIWLDKDALPHYAWPDEYSNQGNSPDNINLRKTDYIQPHTTGVSSKHIAVEDYLMNLFPESHGRTWIPEFKSIEDLSNHDKQYIVFFSKYISYNLNDAISADVVEKAALSIFGYNAIVHENVSPYFAWNQEKRVYRWDWASGSAGSSKLKVINISETVDSYLVDAVPYTSDYDVYSYRGEYIYDDEGNLVTHVFDGNESTELSYLPFMPVRRFVLTKNIDGSFYISQSYKVP